MNYGFLIFLMISMVNVLPGQADSLSIAEKTLSFSSSVSKQSTQVPIPQNISATDGTYDRYIVVSWDQMEPGMQFKVFRSTSESTENMKPVTDAWQQNTFLLDEKGLARGVKYYYRVKAGRNSRDISEFSSADSGFIPGLITAIPTDSLNIGVDTLKIEKDSIRDK